MKQFLYLDTDIINSIIAQSEQGLTTEISNENETGTNKEKDIPEKRRVKLMQAHRFGSLLTLKQQDL